MRLRLSFSFVGVLIWQLLQRIYDSLAWHQNRKRDLIWPQVQRWNKVSQWLMKRQEQLDRSRCAWLQENQIERRGDDGKIPEEGSN